MYLDIGSLSLQQNYTAKLINFSNIVVLIENVQSSVKKITNDMSVVAANFILLLRKRHVAPEKPSSINRSVEQD